MDPVIRYVEQQLERTVSIVNTGDGDLLSLLTGGGSPQVDLVLYVILHSKPFFSIKNSLHLLIEAYRTETG